MIMKNLDNMDIYQGFNLIKITTKTLITQLTT